MARYHQKTENAMMKKEALERYLLDAISSVVSPRGGAYVAGPLATGKKYYELLASGKKLEASQIRTQNEIEMKAFVEGLRQRLAYPVIDPSLIKIDGWTAQEVGDFYIKIISIFAKEIWFMDGWEYSRGATKEFQYAIGCGLRCLDPQGAVISSDSGCALISNVVDHLTALGIDASRFADRLLIIRRR